jgi:hypothetical protein
LVPRADCEPDFADVANAWIDRILAALTEPPVVVAA